MKNVKKLESQEHEESKKSEESDEPKEFEEPEKDEQLENPGITWEPEWPEDELEEHDTNPKKSEKSEEP